MKEQTLKELWVELDPESQVKLLGLISKNLLTTPSTANAYVRGYRIVPEIKRPRLSEVVAKNYTVKIKYS